MIGSDSSYLNPAFCNSRNITASCWVSEGVWSIIFILVLSRGFSRNLDRGMKPIHRRMSVPRPFNFLAQIVTVMCLLKIKSEVLRSIYLFTSARICFSLNSGSAIPSIFTWFYPLTYCSEQGWRNEWLLLPRRRCQWCWWMSEVGWGISS